MLFVSYSKKMDRDVLNSPASLNYRTRCIVNIAGLKRHRIPNCVRALTTIHFSPHHKKGLKENEDASMPFVRYHSL